MTLTNDCFEAFGQPVPENRKQRGLDLLKEKYSNLKDMEIDFVLSLAVEAIEKDRLSSLWDDIKRYVDLTFYYMLVAHLCTDQ